MLHLIKFYGGLQEASGIVLQDGEKSSTVFSYCTYICNVLLCPLSFFSAVSVNHLKEEYKYVENPRKNNHFVKKKVSVSCFRKTIYVNIYYHD